MCGGGIAGCVCVCGGYSGCVCVCGGGGCKVRQSTTGTVSIS